MGVERGEGNLQALHFRSIDDLVGDEALPLGRGQTEQFAKDIVIVLA
jgi:hypothetical protein